MGWANRITVMRGGLTAVLLVLLLVTAPDPSAATYWAAWILFAVTALTDALDGALARRFHEVSVFGRIADPLVDKLLVLGTAIVVLPLDGMSRVLPAWAVVTMLAREFLVTALRGAVEGKGVAFGAVWLGKWKMLLQCLAVGAVLLHGAGLGAARWALDGEGGTWSVAHLLVWAATFLTVYSGIDYGRRAWAVLTKT
jgi:CDP-diacylglycerol--glycerol-3-phosphate 3-phosphatidyltransferase